MVRCNSKILILLGVTVLLLLAGAVQAEPPMLQIPRVTRTPKLEEILVGPSSNNEVSIKDFRQREPGDGVPVSESTVAYLSYDEKNLYIVFVCTDVRDQVRTVGEVSIHGCRAGAEALRQRSHAQRVDAVVIDDL